MSEQTKEFNYLSTEPGVQLFKKGTYKPKELDGLLGIDGLRSQIIDVPVTAEAKAVQAGFFNMQPGESFDLFYTFLEIKIVLKGKLVLHNNGNKIVAEEGDLLIFTPDTNVTFDGSESDGEAFYTVHRLPNPDFV